MNSVGIEVVVSPIEVHHTDSELCELAKLLGSLPGETRVVMEATGNYHLPVATIFETEGAKWLGLVRSFSFRNNLKISLDFC